MNSLKRCAKRIYLTIIIGFFLVTNSSCTQFFGSKNKIKVSDSSTPIDKISEDVYKGPIASIAVARFNDKTPAGGRVWWSPEIGDAMADQMTTALFTSKRFQVLDRQMLETALENNHMERSARTQVDIEDAMRRLDETELLVLTDVTAFKGVISLPEHDANSISWSAASGFRAAHMVVVLKLVDSKTSTIIATARIEGKSTEAASGAALEGVLEEWRNTLKGRAFRAFIQKAVEFLIKTIPQTY